MDLLGCDGYGWRENTEFDLEIGNFFSSYRLEARVLKCGGAGGFGDSAVDGAVGEDVANASTQFAVKVESCEYTARLGQVGRRRLERERLMFNRAGDGLMRQEKQQAPLLA